MTKQPVRDRKHATLDPRELARVTGGTDLDLDKDMSMKKRTLRG